MERQYHIVLIGNPNTGKTSLFNALTGSNQKISNLPGTTVEKKTGSYIYDQQAIKITDLPGIYSLHPKSKDEYIAVKYLIENIETIDKIVFIADASNLLRNLLLLTQIADLGVPVVIALNMMDMANRKNISIDTNKLSQELGMLICPIHARNGQGLKALNRQIIKPGNLFHKTFNNEIQSESHEKISYINWLKNNLLENKEIYTLSAINEQLIADDTTKRYAIINKIVAATQTKNVLSSKNITQQLDQLLLHKFWGFIIFFAILFVIFQVIFSLAEYPMQWIESGFAYGNEAIKSLLPSGTISELITNGIIPGLSGVIVFLPQIILLFFLLALLEDSGYMTRVSFITDKLMRKFGLSGKSVIPLIGGMACAIPSIMATRNIDNYKDRLITILVTPLMSCSARLPVYVLLASLLTVDAHWLGFDFRGLLLLAMYIIGFLASIFFALIFKLILKQKEKSFFVLELPDYRLPRWKNIRQTLLSKTKDFVFNAGKIIMIVSIILWFMANYAPGNAFEKIETKYSTYTLADKQQKVESEKLEASYAGILGKLIEPAIKPLGYDWKIGIAIITSFAAREVFVGTIATIYSANGSEENELLITQKLQEQKNELGLPMYNVAVIVSLLLFYAFAMQCVSTLAVTYRETRSIKWPIIQFVYMSGFAYLISFIAYNLLK